MRLSIFTICQEPSERGSMQRSWQNKIEYNTIYNS